MEESSLVKNPSQKARGPFDFMIMEVTVPFTKKKAPFFVVAMLGLAAIGFVGSVYWIAEYNKEESSGT